MSATKDTETGGGPSAKTSQRDAGVQDAALELESERLRLAGELRSSEARFQMALTAAAIVVFNQDRDLRYTWVGNPALGVRAEEIIGRTDEDLLGVEVARPLTVIKRRVLESGRGERQEVHVVRGGNAGCFDLTVEPLRSPAGEVIGITCAAVDITERKRVEDALRESEAVRRQALEGSPDVVFAIDRKYRLLFNNQRHQEVLLASGGQPFQVGDNVLSPASPPETLALWRAAYDRALQGEPHRLETEWTNREGQAQVFENAFSPLRDAAGAILGVLVVARDLTARRQREKALRESEEHYRLATGAARVALWRMDFLKGRFETDGALERMLGYAPGELGSDPARWRAIVHPEDRDRTHRLWQEASGGESKRYDCDYRLWHKDGSVRWVQVLGHALRDELGRTVALTGTVLDITAHKNLEAERTAALARLAVVEEQERHRLSRELHDQTAQRLVALAVELKTLETNLAAGRPQGERVRSLRQAVDDLQQQVHRVAWDLRAGELVELGLERSLREYIEEWSERAGVPVDVEFRGLRGERLPGALKATLYRVAQEALANVEKHAQARRVNVLLEREAALVRLIVEDDGCGFDVDAMHVAPDDTPRLGLLGMRERVKLAGGTLLVESSPGSGTTILVRLPIVAEAEAS